MNAEHETPNSAKPIPGWACVAIGIGFIGTLVILLAGVRLLSGS
jgi:hypothetical protein